MTASDSSDIEITAETTSHKRPIEISSDSDGLGSDSDACLEVRVAGRPSQRQKLTETPKSVTSSQSTAQTESPIKLTNIKALPGSENINTVGLKDLIGGSDLTMMWQFSFSIDIPFAMKHIHPRALPAIDAHFVTGAKAGDDTKEMLYMQKMLCEYPETISVHAVLLKKRYATHHTKMMILGFGSAELQIVIHTANLTSFDWGNMTQGAWVSPRLTLLRPGQTNDGQFFGDFCQYLGNYGDITTDLIELLGRYNFAPIRAVLVASAPCSARKDDANYTAYGLHKLHLELTKLTPTAEATDHIVMNVSAISSLGPTSEYLTSQVFRALNGSAAGREPAIAPKIIFPTVQDVTDSLNGFDSGIAIHYRQSQFYMKAQTQYLKRYLHKWAARRAGRARAAPHIKTYLRADSTWSRIKWVLLTSANLSKQAWGVESKAGVFEVQSFELGVLLHPALFGDAASVELVPAWKSDSGVQTSQSRDPVQPVGVDVAGTTMTTTALERIPVRMAYDLPPVPYDAGRDRAWDPSISYTQKDWRGGTWRV